MDYLLLGKQIRKQRQSMGWTQERLAEAIGVSTSFVGHIERGTRKASIDTLVEIANAMKVSTDYLLVGNLDNGTEIPERSGRLTSSQRLVLQEMLTVMSERIQQWNREEEETAD